MILTEKLLQAFNIPESYFDFMSDRIQDVYKMLNDFKKPYFPQAHLIFNFLIENPKVVIVGQDPYPAGNYAIGKAFATNKSPTPPSLRFIKEALKEYYDFEEFDDSLKHWEDQGVMLLNSALTVQQYKPGSHAKLWENFISEFIEYLYNKYDPIFVFLGKKAQNFNKEKYKSYEDYHPASNGYANKKLFKGLFFRDINKLKTIIKWQGII